MVKISKQRIFFISLVIILLLGLSVVSAQDSQAVTKSVKMEKTAKNPVNNIAKVNTKNNKKFVTKTVTNNNENNTKVVKKENQKLVTDKKTNTTEVNNKESKQLTKKTDKTTKEAQTESVTSYSGLQTLLTTTSNSELIVNLDGDDDIWESTGVFSIKDSITKLTINGNSKTIDGGSSNSFFTFETIDLTINNLTVQNFRGGNGIITQKSYGNLRSNITVNNSKFINNRCTGTGGVFYQYQSSVAEMTIINSTFTSNNVTGSGGVLYQPNGGILTIKDSNFTYNNASKAGVIIQDAGSKTSKLNIENSNFMYNKATNDGGVIFQGNSADLTIVNSNFTSNSAGEGGAIRHWGGELNIFDSRFISNSATGMGGVISQYQGLLNINNTVFESNTCPTKGGAIYTAQVSQALINNTSFKGNRCTGTASTSAGIGGALFLATDGVMVIDNSDFSLNHATFDGGAIYGAITSLKINRTNFTKNDALFAVGNFKSNRGGGAIYSKCGVEINECNFTGNFACVGGALYINSVLNVNNSNFIENYADCHGAVLVNSTGPSSINNSNITRNNGTINSQSYLRSVVGSIGSGLFTLDHNTFDSNWVKNSAAYILKVQASTKIVNNLFVNNTDNQRDMLLNDIVNEIHDNTYIDNYLYVRKITIDNEIVLEDYEKEVDIVLWPGYNDTVRNGTVKIFINAESEEYACFNVKDGKCTVKINLTDLPLKENLITLEYNTLSKHYYNRTTTFKLTKNITTLTVSANETVYVGQYVTINGTLTDLDDAPIDGVNVDLYINDQYNDTTQVQEGIYSFNYLTNALGIHNITVKFNGDENYPASSINTTSNVLPTETNITVSATDIIIGQNTSITGRLYEIKNNQAVADTIVTIIVDSITVSENVQVGSDGQFTFSYNATRIGDIEVKVVYNGDDVRYGSSANLTTFTVSPRKTNITIDNNKTVFIGQNVTISGVVYDELGEVVANTVVDIKVGNDLIKDVSVKKDGTFTINYEMDNVGSYSITVTYNNDTTRYVASTNTSSVKVNKRSTNITINNKKTVIVGENITISGVVYDELGEVVANTVVDIKVGDDLIKNVSVSKDGTFSVKYYLNNIGTYKITVIYNNDTTGYISSTNTSSVKVNKRSTNITISNKKSVTIGDKITITGVLSDELGETIPNTKLTIRINENFIDDNLTVDEKGNYKFSYKTTTTGTNTIKISYAGSKDYYLASTNTSSFKVSQRKLKTVLTINTKDEVLVNTKVNITGKLIDEKKNPVAKADIILTVDGVSKTVKTDSNGNYVLEYKPTTSGKKQIKAKFAGDESYNSTSNSTTMIVKEKSKITVKSKTILCGEKVKLEATVKDMNGKAINAGKVVFKINMKTVLDSKGNPRYAAVKNCKAVLTVTPESGLYNKNSDLNAVYSGTSKYMESRSNTAKLLIHRRNATIKFTTKNIKAQSFDTITIKTKIKDVNGSAVKSGNVTFKINSLTLGKAKIKNGIATFKYKLNGMKAKTYTITAVFSSNMYNRVQKTINLTVVRTPTKIKVNPITTKSKTFTVKAKILDDKNKLVKKTTRVTIKINNQTYVNQTKVSKGKVNIKIPTKLKKGKYTLTIIAGVNGYYEESRNSTKLRIIS